MGCTKVKITDKLRSKHINKYIVIKHKYVKFNVTLSLLCTINTLNDNIYE